MLELKNINSRTKLSIGTFNNSIIITINQSKEQRLRYAVPKEQIPQIIEYLQNQIKD